MIQAQEEVSYKIDLDNLDLVKLSYNLWENYGSLIDASLLKKTDEDNNIFIYSTPVGIFLLCLYVIHEEAVFYGIDWSLQYLKMIESNGFINTDILEVTDTYRSEYGITYHNMYVEKVICKNDMSVYGFHLHIGNHEESVDAYLLSDGKYKVTIN